MRTIVDKNFNIFKNEFDEFLIVEITIDSNFVFLQETLFFAYFYCLINIAFPKM